MPRREFTMPLTASTLTHTLRQTATEIETETEIGRQRESERVRVKYRRKPHLSAKFFAQENSKIVECKACAHLR